MATTPYTDGQTRGRYTLTGAVSQNAAVNPTADITVMPSIDTPPTTSVTTTAGPPGYLPRSFKVTQNAGSSTQFSRTVYVTWDTYPDTSGMASGTVFTVRGIIGDCPFAKAVATVTVS
ncbi:hypothetical protein [Streptomyces actuosus]|uniref:Uncharacterized protein n=1 Tax=Streptomyces actuosus TaxID=1885 RepID=A0A2U9NUJ7_STRAS|nr:hypothetical protein [Streptomyces actuosus]AWT40929.1 hypothetical protein DMT42_00215 [Streptomyces actuosus]